MEMDGCATTDSGKLAMNAYQYYLRVSSVMAQIKIQYQVACKTMAVFIALIFFVGEQAIAQVTDLPRLPSPNKSMPAEADLRKGPVLPPPVDENNKTSMGPKSLSDSTGDTKISAADRAMISKACRSSQYAGPAAFHACENRQVTTLKGSSAPSLDGISNADLALIDKACKSSSYSGPAAYRACQHRQVTALKGSSAPSLDGISTADLALIIKACRSSSHSGPAAYRACQHRQVSQLRALQITTPGRKL